jgi:hypothetical protein
VPSGSGRGSSAARSTSGPPKPSHTIARITALPSPDGVVTIIERLVPIGQ